MGLIPCRISDMEWGLGVLAAGERVEGELNGTWGEAHLYKFLETLAYSLAIRRDPESHAGELGGHHPRQWLVDAGLAVQRHRR